MPNPSSYTPAYSFDGYQAVNPDDPLPAAELDNELANISSAIVSVRGALLDIRASDGSLVNGIVDFDALDPDVAETIRRETGSVTVLDLSPTVFASQAQAQAGIVNDKIMTPLRTREAIDARTLPPTYTYGGTANAITLTTGLSLTSLPVGFPIGFVASSANTGNTTINVDGLGAVQCLTVTGVSLPSGYIRTGRVTYGRWNGTNFILNRDVQYFEQSGAKYWRFEDGRQEAILELSGITATSTTALGSSFREASARVWTFASGFAFSTTPSVSGCMDASLTIIVTQSSSTAEYLFYVSTFTSRTVSGNLTLQAVGRWYNPA